MLRDFERPSQVISSASCNDSSSGWDRISDDVSARMQDVRSDGCSDSTIHKKRDCDPAPPKRCSWKQSVVRRAGQPSIVSPPSEAFAECDSTATPPTDSLGRWETRMATARCIRGENGEFQRDHRFAR